VGAPGAGDPFFPLQGNGGYDISHYTLWLKYDPAARRLDGVTSITATTTQRLTRFDLDLRRQLKVSAALVNGRAAAFSQPAALKQELVVTPPRPLAAGERVEVTVSYAGVPPVITDPDGSIEGMVPTPDGVHTVGEPQGSPGWFPCNDTPTDKATYDVVATVPAGLTAVSNGDLMPPPPKPAVAGWSTFIWHEAQPMATYLATVTVGRFHTATGTTPDGVPYYIAVDPTVVAQSRGVLAKLPAMVDYYSRTFGPYPFSSAGAVVDPAKNVGYALENQTRPVFDSPPDELTLAHEVAHQWYGDAVTLRHWRDIWVNEGFAEFSSWLWSELFDRAYSTPASKTSFWNPPPADPGDPADIFDPSVYERGAMTLQALRVKLGDPTFFKIMRGWYAGHKYGNGTVDGFSAYTQKVSGEDLKHFFHVWLYQPGKPAHW